MENALVDKLDSTSREKCFHGSKRTSIVTSVGVEAAVLWQTPHGREGKSIYILVVPSWHCIFGYNKRYSVRLNNGCAFLTVMSVLEAADIIPKGSTEREQRILRAALIRMEGFKGNLPNEACGSFHTAVRYAVAEGYFGSPVHAGVGVLANALSENGMNAIHVAILMAVLGYDGFS